MSTYFGRFKVKQEKTFGQIVSGANFFLVETGEHEYFRGQVFIDFSPAPGINGVLLELASGGGFPIIGNAFTNICVPPNNGLRIIFSGSRGISMSGFLYTKLVDY